MNTTTKTPPTTSQLKYLRALAARTATTFASPGTRQEASSEIGRLRRLEPQPWPERSSDEGRDQEHFGYAPAVHVEEVRGFWSSAAWAASASGTQGSSRELGRCAAELARYRLSSGERVLLGEYTRACVVITDRPHAAAGRRYVVDRQPLVDGPAALDALIADYVAQALDLDEVPMAGDAVRQLLTDGPGR